MEIARPYLLFLGDVPDALAAKTAIGIVDWRKDWCLGQVRMPGCAADTGLSDMSIAEGAEAGAKTFIIGAVNAGGRLPEHWVESVVEALDAGMDVASGLHVRLASVPAIKEAAERNGRQLHDVRHSSMAFATGKGTKRAGKRILAVGTDCSVGKKYTALAMDKAITVTVPVALKGEPAGVKQQGGVLDFVNREVQIECMPTEIPEHLEVDVSELMIGDGVRLRELITGVSWKPVSELDMLLAHVVAPRVEEEEEAEAEGRGSLAIDGRMVDVPVVKRAQNLLAFADAVDAQRR